MSEVKDMYKIACYVDSEEYDPPRKDFNEPLDAITDCANRFANKKRRLSVRRATSILNNAIDHKYVKVVGDKPVGYTLIVTSGRGRQLVAKTWLVHRKGLKEQTMKEYPHTREMYKTKYVALVGSAGTIIGASIGYLIGRL